MCVRAVELSKQTQKVWPAVGTMDDEYEMATWRTVHVLVITMGALLLWCSWSDHRCTVRCDPMNEPW